MRERVSAFGPNGHHGSVVVLDFGAQYSQLIARRVREAHVFSEILPGSASAQELARREPAAIILSGGPSSVYEPGAPSCDPAIFDLDVPILGICYGHQLMTRTLGGEVQRSDLREFGRTRMAVSSTESRLLPQVRHFDVWMSHADAVTTPPKGFLTTARTESTPVAVMEDADRRLFGVQYHPEVVHTEFGRDLLQRFLFHVAELSPNWTPSSIVADAIADIRAQVGDAHAVCALSGGVDSAVAATLVHRAIGERLTCVFVDHGLLRQGESEQVTETFRHRFGSNLIVVPAHDQFLSVLAKVRDPERKRKLIGKTFIRTFEQVCNDRLGDARFLVQGTIYPDRIESGGNGAAGIKSHHNVGGLPKKMRFALVEPLKDLFKDEVREVGIELGLPEEIVWRQPFPGPGLAVRILGSVTEERLEILRAADAIVTDEIRAAGLEREIWQAFAVLPDVKSVGVQGDGRTYSYPIIVRAVTSEDAMTADWVRLPYEVLDVISRRIVNEVGEVNRVVYDVTSKPPATIEWM